MDRYALEAQYFPLTVAYLGRSSLVNCYDFFSVAYNLNIVRIVKVSRQGGLCSYGKGLNKL